LRAAFGGSLLIVVECLCLGTIAELWLAKHTKEPIQLLPFALCGIGFLAALTVLLRPQRTTLLALRVVMIVTVLGALGMYEHMASTWTFEAEMRPGAGTRTWYFPCLAGR